jgi:hypothetical protein
VIQKHEYAALNAGDFVDANKIQQPKGNTKTPLNVPAKEESDDGDDDDAEFSGSDDEEREEWERRRKAKQGR